MPSDREDVLVRVGLERIEVEEEVVGMLHVLATGMERVHLDAAQVDDVEQGGRVVDDQVIDHSGLRVLRQHLAAMDPLRRVRGCGLLVEERAFRAVRHAFHRQRASVEVGADQVGHVPVVREEVSLRVLLLRPEDLVQVGEAQVPPVDLDPPGVAVLACLELLRELEHEGRAA